MKERTEQIWKWESQQRNSYEERNQETAKRIKKVTEPDNQLICQECDKEWKSTGD